MRPGLYQSALLVLLLSAPVFAQQPKFTPNFTEDQLKSLFQQIGSRAARLQPMVEGIHAAEWVIKGAPDAYVAQQKSTLEQLAAVQADMSALAQHPEQMTDTMKALFRVQALHRLLGTLLGGVRRYQNPAVADLIDSVAAEDQSDLDRVEQHLVDLATLTEQQLQVMDAEAQRCRGILLKQPAPTKPGPHR
jgi:hypothetical protein